MKTLLFNAQAITHKSTREQCVDLCEFAIRANGNADFIRDCLFKSRYSIRAMKFFSSHGISKFN